MTATISVNEEKESYLYVEHGIHDHDRLLSKLNRQLFDQNVCKYVGRISWAIVGM